MRRGKSFSCSTGSISLLCFLQIVMLVAVLLLHHHHQSCDAITNSNNQTYCPPSSCGKISNIKHPFRLKDDPSSCGDPMYELSCENNITTLTLFSGKYYVKEINYKNYTIQLVDPGIEEGNCSSIPRYFLTPFNFTSSYIPRYFNYHNYHGDAYQIDYGWDIGLGYIIYLKCSKAVNDDPGYVDTAPCINSDSESYLYAFATDFYVWGYQDEDSRRNYFSVGRLKDYCQVKLVAMSSSGVREDVPDRRRYRPRSYEEIHGMLLYGFELSWISGACRESCGNNMQCGWNYRTGGIKCYDDYCYYPLGKEVNKRCDQLPKQLILVQDIIVGIAKAVKIQTYLRPWKVQG